MPQQRYRALRAVASDFIGEFPPVRLDLGIYATLFRFLAVGAFMTCLHDTYRGSRSLADRLLARTGPPGGGHTWKLDIVHSVFDFEQSTW